jgi:hypothetical protein
VAPPRVLAVAIAVAGVVAIAGCSTSSGTSSSPPGTTSSAATPTGSSSTATTTPTAENLVITNAVRAQLVTAGAALNGLPASAYTGLAAGTTYYAYDPVTATYWAGAALVPSHSSQRAQVSVQDDGSYILYSRPSGGAWKAQPVGLAGIEGATCATSVPASILAMWGWAPGTCRPAA